MSSSMDMRRLLSFLRKTVVLESLQVFRYFKKITVFCPRRLFRNSLIILEKRLCLPHRRAEPGPNWNSLSSWISLTLVHFSDEGAGCLSLPTRLPPEQVWTRQYERFGKFVTLAIPKCDKRYSNQAHNRVFFAD